MLGRIKKIKGVVAISVALVLAGCGSDDSTGSGSLLPEKGEGAVNSNSIDLVISDERLEPIIKLEPIVAISETPSHVNALFKVVDDDLNPVTGLAEKHSDTWKDHFGVSYGEDIGMDVESYTTIEPATNLELPTTIAIDISSSISDEDFVDSVTAVRDALLDFSGGEPESRLLANQLISVLVFDSTVTPYPDYGLTRDPLEIEVIFDELLSSDYRSLRNSSNSTNLYGAAKDGLTATLNFFSPTETPLGTLIVISDGNENANLVTLDDVITQRDSSKQRVYTLTSQTERKPWFDLASAPENEIELSELTDVTAAITQIFSDIDTTLDGYYVLKHSTASQSGSQKLILDYEDDNQSQYQMDYDYDTTSFSGSRIKLEIEAERQVSSLENSNLLATVHPYFNVLEPELQLDWYIDDLYVGTDLEEWTYETAPVGVYKLEVIAPRSPATEEDDVQERTWLTVAPYTINALRNTFIWDLKLELEGADINHVWRAQPFNKDGEPLLDDEDEPKICEFDPATPLIQSCECSLFGSENNVLMSMTGTETNYCVVKALDANTDELLGAMYTDVNPFVMEYTLTSYYISSTLDSAIDFEIGTSDPHLFYEQWDVIESEQEWHEKMGGYVIKSPSISHGQTTTMSFSANFSTLGFDFLTRTEEGYDFLEVYIDGEQHFRYSGVMNEWRSTESIVVPFGLHDVEIRYVKDATKSHSSDAVYIDNMIYL